MSFLATGRKGVYQSRRCVLLAQNEPWNPLQTPAQGPCGDPGFDQSQNNAKPLNHIKGPGSLQMKLRLHLMQLHRPCIVTTPTYSLAHVLETGRRRAITYCNSCMVVYPYVCVRMKTVQHKHTRAECYASTGDTKLHSALGG